MIEIICGTNRPKSRSRLICEILNSEFQKNAAKTSILDVGEIPIEELSGNFYFKDKPKRLTEYLNRIVESQGLVIVVPEYNGSFPGILKLFIDHWPFPQAFHFRPIWLIGIGGRFGGLRAVEQLSQVFSYRQAHIFPFNLVITNIPESLKDGTLTDKFASELIVKNSKQFLKYVQNMKTLELSP